MRKILMFLVVVVSWACEETIELDIDQTQPITIVEGLVTNEMKNHYVKISKSVGFYDAGKGAPVTNASVMVFDNDGNNYSYAYNAEDSAYYSEVEFQGIIDNYYTLEISLDGNEITAVDTLKRVTPIDAVLWKIDDDEKEDPEDEGYFYEITLTAKEPKETVDYYLFHFYRNDTVQRFDWQTGVFFADDVFIQENIDNFPAPVFYKERDTATFEMLSLTKFTYEYYSELSTILNNDGGMFGSVPANPFTNLNGENILGCFQTSAIDRKTIIVGDPEFERKD